MRVCIGKMMIISINISGISWVVSHNFSLRKSRDRASGAKGLLTNALIPKYLTKNPLQK